MYDIQLSRIKSTELCTTMKYNSLDDEKKEKQFCDSASSTDSKENKAYFQPQAAMEKIIKIHIRETENKMLYSANSSTITIENPKFTTFIEVKGHACLVTESESQTLIKMFKTRSINTDRLRLQEACSYVSNYDMFDTYAELENITRTLNSTTKQSPLIAVTSSSFGHYADATLK